MALRGGVASRFSRRSAESLSVSWGSRMHAADVPCGWKRTAATRVESGDESGGVGGTAATTGALTAAAVTTVVAVTPGLRAHYGGTYGGAGYTGGVSGAYGGGVPTGGSGTQRRRRVTGGYVRNRWWRMAVTEESPARAATAELRWKRGVGRQGRVRRRVGSRRSSGSPALGKACSLFCPRFPYSSCSADFDGPPDCSLEVPGRVRLRPWCELRSSTS